VAVELRAAHAVHACLQTPPRSGFQVAARLSLDTGWRFPRRCLVEASRNAFNTIPPNDIGVYELLNELVRDEPAGSTDMERMAELTEEGIKPLPATGTEILDAGTWCWYAYAAPSPALCMADRNRRRSTSSPPRTPTETVSTGRRPTD
jgi:hypothetical protein